MTLTQVMPVPNVLCMGYIIVTDSGKIIVIDGGLDDQPENILLDEIRRVSGQRIPYIDAWFFTHPHSDHFSEFRRMVRKMHNEKAYFNVRNFYFHFPSFDYAEKHFVAKDVYCMRDFRSAFNEFYGDMYAYDRYPKVYVGQEIFIDDVKFKILRVPNENITTNFVNNQSIVFSMEATGQRFLFLGDLGKEGGDELCRMYGTDLKCDVCQMSHHGQKGVGWNVYQLASPKYCLFPSSYNGFLNIGPDGVPGTGSCKIGETLACPPIGRAIHIVAGIDGTKDYTLPIDLKKEGE